MTKQEETTYIHDILDYMLQPSQQHQEYHSFFLQRGVPKDDLLTLFRLMKEANLIQSAPNANSVINLTGHGRTLAQHTGGYKGYLAAQQQAEAEQQAHQQEQRELNRVNVRSAQASAKAANRSMWVSIASLGTGLLIGILPYLMAPSRSEVAGLTQQIQQLNRKVRQLEDHLAKQRLQTTKNHESNRKVSLSDKP